MSIYEYYKASILENLPKTPENLNFKQDARYQYVLEHVTAEQGKQYLDLTKSEFSQFYDEYKNNIVALCKTNDISGKPNRSYFFDFCSCSATNLRYLYQSLLIASHVRNLNINSLNIIEIGGGYGGLCLFLHKLSDYLNIKINSYTIFDLEEAEALQKKYLKEHDIFLADKNNLSKDSFLISNYAFSELPLDLRLSYEQSVINPFCNHGFLAWNGCELSEFVKHRTVTSQPEKPSTHPNNKYVYF